MQIDTEITIDVGTYFAAVNLPYRTSVLPGPGSIREVSATISYGSIQGQTGIWIGRGVPDFIVFARHNQISGTDDYAIRTNFLGDTPIPVVPSSGDKILIRLTETARQTFTDPQLGFVLSLRVEVEINDVSVSVPSYTNYQWLYSCGTQHGVHHTGTGSEASHVWSDYLYESNF